MSANEKQVAGNHYKTGKMQHWDFVHACWLDYFLGCSTKYLSRWWLKGTPLQDIEKSRHFLEKWLELGKQHCTSYPNQDEVHRELDLWCQHLSKSMYVAGVPLEAQAHTLRIMKQVFTSQPSPVLLEHYDYLLEYARKWQQEVTEQAR